MVREYGVVGSGLSGVFSWRIVGNFRQYGSDVTTWRFGAENVKNSIRDPPSGPFGAWDTEAKDVHL